MIFLQSCTSTGYFSNSTGSFVTNCQFSPFIAQRASGFVWKSSTTRAVYSRPCAKRIIYSLTPLIQHLLTRHPHQYYDTFLHDHTFQFTTPSFMRLRRLIMRRLEPSFCHMLFMLNFLSSKLCTSKLHPFSLGNHLGASLIIGNLIIIRNIDVEWTWLGLEWPLV